MEQDVTTLKLEKLAELYEERDRFEAAKEAKRQEILKPVADALTDLDVETATAASIINTSIGALEEMIKKDATDLGEGLKSEKIRVKFVSGRESYDTKALDTYAAVGHPEILQFKKKSNPYATIERIR